MGFDKTMGIAERVNDATEIERVRAVPTEGETVEKAKRVVDVTILGAESVNLLRPVSPIGDALFWVFIFKSRLPRLDK